MADDDIVTLPVEDRGSGGGGPHDGIGERVAKVEVRIEAPDSRPSRIDDELGRPPSKEFLAKEFLPTAVIAVGGIGPAAALPFAALTFDGADNAAETTQQAEQARQAPAGAPTQQPIVIMMPSTPPPLPGSVQPKPEVPAGTSKPSPQP